MNKIASKLVSFCVKYQIVLVNCLLIILGFCVLGLPYNKMGFLNDDFGVFLNCRLKSWGDVWRVLCSDMNTWTFGFKISKNFLTIVYRPIPMLLLSLEHFLWGLNAYYYYLVNILLHSINSVLIYRIFSWFLDKRLAFVGALLFLFHGSIGSWIVLICTDQDILNLTFFLLVVLSYKKYLDTEYFRYYALSGFLFLLCLFTREPLSIFPLGLFLFWIIIGFYKKLKVADLLINAIQKVYLFIFPLIIYVSTRFVLFGFDFSDLGYLSGPNAKTIKYYIWNILEFMKDITGFTFLSNPDPRGKILFFIPFVLLFLFLFIKNTKKIYLFVLGLAILLFSWPSLLMTHHARYIYAAIPFFILFLLIAIRYSKINFLSGWKSWIVYMGLFVFIGWGIYDNMSKISKNEEITHIADLALKDFVQTYISDDLTGREKFVFVGLAHWLFFTGLTQAVWLYSGNEQLQVYHDLNIDFILRDYRNIESYKNIKEGFHILPIKNGYRFISHDDRLYFSVSQPNVNKIGDEYMVPNNMMSIRIVNELFDKYKAKDVSIFFNKNYFKPEDKVMFFSWDWKEKRFVLLPNCFDFFK